MSPKTPVDGPADVEVDHRRQWLLVGVVVLATLVIPALVYLRPPQLPYWVALLVFPLAPAFLLGGTAVYVALSSRRAAATSGQPLDEETVKRSLDQSTGERSPEEGTSRHSPGVEPRDTEPSDEE